jgi:hypothetical protein
MKWEEELKELIDGSLTNLHLAGIDLSGKIKDLTNALRNPDCKLEFLSIRNNNGVDLEDVRDLAYALQSFSPKIRYFELSNNKLYDEGASAIAFALLGSSIRFLSLCHNQIGIRGATTLSNILQDPGCRLEYLELAHNNLYDEGATMIASSLPHSSIIHIDLSANHVGSQGIASLSRAFMHPNCNIRSANLNDNQFGDEGIIHLSRALLKADCNIVCLELKSTNIRLKGAEALASVLESSTSKLIRLDITKNKLLDEVEGGIVNGAPILSATKTNYIMLDLRIEEMVENYTVCREAKEMSERNYEIFYTTCNTILRGEYVQPNDKEMAFLQCHVISRVLAYTVVGEFFPADISYDEDDALINNTISQLQAEYDTIVMGWLITLINMPKELAELITDYVEDDDSQSYVSFYKPIEDSSRSRKRRHIYSDEDTIKRLCTKKEDEREADYSEAENNTLVEPGANSSISDSASGDGGDIPPNQIRSAQGQSDKEQPLINQQYTRGEQFNVNNELGRSMQTRINKKEASPKENLLTVIFSWIKDLSEDLQQKILSLDSMRQILELLQIRDEGLIITQFIEEAFELEYKEYYGKDDSNGTEYASAVTDAPISLDATTGIILSGGIIIDPLQKEIYSSAPHIFKDISY